MCSIVKNRHDMHGASACVKHSAIVYVYHTHNLVKVKATIEKDLCESFQLIHYALTNLWLDIYQIHEFPKL